jgi:hypothetical protein
MRANMAAAQTALQTTVTIPAVGAVSAVQTDVPTSTSDSGSGGLNFALVFIVGCVLLCILAVSGYCCIHHVEHTSASERADGIEVEMFSAQVDLGTEDATTFHSESSHSAAATVLEAGWTQHADEAGTPYYHNAATKETSWELPAAACAAPVASQPGRVHSSTTPGTHSVMRAQAWLRSPFTTKAHSTTPATNRRHCSFSQAT